MNVRSIRYKISIPSILSARSSRDVGQDVRFARGMSRLTQAFTPLWKEIKPKSCWLNPTIRGNDSLPQPRCVLKTSLSRASGCVGSRVKNAAPVFRIANIGTKVQKPVSGAKGTALPSLILKRDFPFQHCCQRLGMDLNGSKAIVRWIAAMRRKAACSCLIRYVWVAAGRALGLAPEP